MRGVTVPEFVIGIFLDLTGGSHETRRSGFLLVLLWRLTVGIGHFLGIYLCLVGVILSRGRAAGYRIKVTVFFVFCRSND